MPRQLALPHNLAPRLISREAAAAYVNLSPTTFDEMVSAGKMPAPKVLSERRKAWDVRMLDAAVDGLPSAETTPEDTTWEDIDAA